MFQKLGLQSYSVRNYLTDEASVADTFRRLAAIGYSEVQTAGDLTSCPETARAILDANGFTCVGTHVAMPEDVDNIAEYVRYHQALGTNRPGIGGFHCDNKQKMVDFIEKANRLAENLAPYGMQFTYHHHAFEFSKLKDANARGIDFLLDGLDSRILFVLDTHWLQAGGVSITGWLEKLAGRCELLHLKDFAVTTGTNSSFITECGSGNIDFAEVLKVAEQTGVKHVCVEQDTWPLGFDSVDYCMRKSYEHLAQFMDLK